MRWHSVARIRSPFCTLNTDRSRRPPMARAGIHGGTMLTFSLMGIALLTAADSSRIDVPKGSVICNSEALAERYVRSESTPIMEAPGCSRIGVALESQEVVSATERVVQVKLSDGRTRRIRYLIVDSAGY